MDGAYENVMSFATCIMCPVKMSFHANDRHHQTHTHKHTNVPNENAFHILFNLQHIYALNTDFSCASSRPDQKL